MYCNHSKKAKGKKKEQQDMHSHFFSCYTKTMSYSSIQFHHNKPSKITMTHENLIVHTVTPRKHQAHKG
jgi:thioredoxin-related protein